MTPAEIARSPMKADLEALADRVEALTGPDREVDAAIVLALYPEAQIGEYCGYEDVVFHASPLVDNKEFLPLFTASIDAAMSLVPVALHFEVTTTGFKPGATVCGDSLMGVHEGAYAATPALALCAAALRAQAAQSDQ